MAKTELLCMNPGPIAFESRVLQQMRASGISHCDPKVVEIFGCCLEKMRKVFLSEDGQPLIVTGSGTLGWDMVGLNLIQPGDSVLVINTGYFGDNFADCLSRYGADITHLRADSVGSRPSNQALTDIFKTKSFQMVIATHVDTSTGVINDLAQISATVRQFNKDCLIVVDGVCSVGGEELRMTEWDLDVVLTGSQKCIGVPAGLSLLMLRPRAIKTFESHKGKKKRGYYCDWEKWLPIMKNYEARKPSYFATPAVNHIYALNVAFDILLENGGMDKRFQEHLLVSNAIKQAIKLMGCELIPAEGCGANTMTCVRYPKGVNGGDFLPKVVANGVSLAGGLHSEIKTQYFRIGHMGPSSRRLDHIYKTIQAIQNAFVACGHKLPQNKQQPKSAVDALKGQIISAPKCHFQAVYHGCPAPVECQVLTVVLFSAAFAAGFFFGAKRN